ncbi:MULTISPECIES: low molecular weight phosphatase family protein [Azorhizobium]|uniref:Low molecular weight phosphotyrosine protein phosphatase n=1 Tax=Azorhizobium caulinodans (strain ATCC 43989 / DSM 5975 / JCM 20966 / LMG 6465 / NBRC 14845 / NCIMB 13405 / ORS 571) TaxID=438753 RepID=A8IC14_AZOC5|nr:low molecular weight phosphatase family protein [Azorhizobium]TDT93600.1 protein-tyrosine-phosphatase [Azorhizobium sp. AG788]BAF89145.1 low molecular weight phosphotyrosine protein phosphatase [Azorhizobium caulinodans ORS 571]
MEPSVPADRSARPQSVLFLCGQNVVRSVMAAALARHLFGKSIYIASAGVIAGEADPFVAAAMDEIGLDVSRHRPRSLEELEEYEGLSFDLAISLSPDAHHLALEATRTNALTVEYWPTPDPTLETGNREQRLAAYRQVREDLEQRIRARFKPGR